VSRLWLGGKHRAIFDAAVSGNAAATYEDEWLVDARPRYPLRASGNLAATVTFSSRQLNAAVLVNHNIADGASASASGFGTIPTTPWRANGIPRNYGVFLETPITTGSISVAANGSPAIVGEFWAGLLEGFPGFQHGRRQTPDKPFGWEGQFKSLAPYAYGVSAQRRVAGTITLASFEEFDALDNIFESQDNGSYPILFWEDIEINDPWLCQFSYEEAHGENAHTIQIEITEIPRFKWPA